MKDKIIPILIFFAAAIGFSFIHSLFQKKPKEDRYFQMVLALKDSINEGLKRQLIIERSHKDEITKLLLQKDTVLIREYKTNTVKYEKIPVVVGNLSDDELRRAVEEFR